jgi:hypothetical protein
MKAIVQAPTNVLAFRVPIWSVKFNLFVSPSSIAIASAKSRRDQIEASKGIKVKIAVAIIASFVTPVIKVTHGTDGNTSNTDELLVQQEYK